MMVPQARWKPALIAGNDRLAGLQLFADALVDQHVGVDRHADGQHDTGDARQRQRRAEQRQRAEDQDDVEDQRDVGEDAEQAVGDDHEGDDERSAATIPAVRPERIESAPRLAPTERSSTMSRLAGSAPARSSTARSLALCGGEVAADLARAAGDRLLDDRRGDHLVVEHDGEALADIRAEVISPKVMAPRVSNWKLTTERDGLLVEAGLRIDQRLAAERDVLVEQFVAAIVRWAGSW